MNQVFEILGFGGAVLVAVAYIPQIVHLIREHCANGLSLKAWFTWLLAALLILPQAFISADPVFITLQIINVVAILFISLFAYFHQGKICLIHKHKFL